MTTKREPTEPRWVRYREVDGKLYRVRADGSLGQESKPRYDPVKANSPAAFEPDDDTPLLTMRELKQFRRVNPPASATPKSVAMVRKGLRMSQAVFAAVFDLPVATIRDWEAKRREPDQAAKVLLRVIDAQPKLVQEVVAKTRPAPAPGGRSRKRAA